MSSDYIDDLQEEIPELFDDRQLAPGWEDEWLLIPIDDPEAGTKRRGTDYEELERNPAASRPTSLEAFGFSEIPTFGAEPTFPGAPVIHDKDTLPPPDALGFYLPFHYFYPSAWGIYLVLERVQWLARQIEVYSSDIVAGQDAVNVARLFLYGHEAFHHSIEAFATRLEVTHRIPLYRKGFEEFYRRGPTVCREEAFATAYGYRKVRDTVFREPDDPEKRSAALGALSRYIQGCPQGYNEALDFVEDDSFSVCRAHLAEDYHSAALPKIRRLVDPEIWLLTSYMFAGIAHITSKVSYVVRYGFPIATRHGLGLRYLRLGDLKRGLRKAGCRFVRNGGRHEIWQNPNGHNFPIPRHPGDLCTGTLAKIIKEADIPKSVSQFVEEM